jgi:hypothetical protein
MARVRHAAFAAVLSAVRPDLAASGAGDGSGREGQHLEESIRFARTNGLYYPYVRRLLDDGVALPAAERARWDLELGRLAKLVRSLHTLNDVSEREGVPYAVIKSVRAVPHVPRDVDIFVPEAHLRGMIDGLRRAGLELRYWDDAEISLTGPDTLRIDLYCRIEYVGRPFLSEDFLARSSARHRTHGVDHPGLTEEADLLLNLSHDLFGHSTVTLLDLIDFVDRRDAADRAACERFARSFGWADVFRMWNARIDAMEQAIRAGTPPPFPVRHGWRFLWSCVNALGEAPARGDRLSVALSFLWDDAVSLSEAYGIGDALRRSPVARGFMNAAGHRLRIMRGDRKKAGALVTQRGG